MTMAVLVHGGFFLVMFALAIRSMHMPIPMLLIIRSIV
jgi:hypothetical protein